MDVERALKGFTVVTFVLMVASIALLVVFNDTVSNADSNLDTAAGPVVVAGEAPAGISTSVLDEAPQVKAQAAPPVLRSALPREHLHPEPSSTKRAIPKALQRRCRQDIMQSLEDLQTRMRERIDITERYALSAQRATLRDKFNAC